MHPIKEADINQPHKKIINVVSLDFDGCINNSNYLSSQSPGKLIECNAALFSQLKKNVTVGCVDEVVFMVGSSRQDFYIDRDHFMHGTGTCFPVYQSLPAQFANLIDNRIPCRLDNYLLADTFGNRTPGDNFRHIIAHNKFYGYSTMPPEISKLPILYAQMHKLAAENPDATIIYDFFDDREDIYSPLHYFFSSNTDIMPSNVTLRIHAYSGEEVTPVKSPIKGTGATHPDFEANILLMHELTNYNSIANSAERIEQCNIMSHMEGKQIFHLLDSTPLQQFKNCVAIKTEVSRLEHETNEVVRIFENSSDYLPFITAIKQLQQDLLNDLEKIQKNKYSIIDTTQSDAITLSKLTTEMLSSLRQASNSKTNKNEMYQIIIEEYHDQCRRLLSSSVYDNIGKFLSTTTIFLTGTYIGNQLINITNSTSKILAGGFVAGVASSLLLFKPNKYAKQIEEIAQTTTMQPKQ